MRPRWRGDCWLRGVRLSLALLLTALARTARADEAAGDARLPASLRDKPRMADAAQKVEGGFFSGLPLVGYDPSTGLGLGVGGYYTMNGSRASPLFEYTPYRHRLYAQVYLTTGGYQQHQLAYDGLYVLGSPFRVRATLTFERNTSANYFGIGQASLDPLSFHGRGHQTYADQTAAASALQPGGVASPDYNHYAYDKPWGNVSIEREFWGGKLRAQYGVVVQYVSIHKDDGDKVQGIDASGQSQPAVEGPTKLGLDCAAGVATGCTGGWNNVLKAGVAFDTRDFEPDPRSGVFVDATGEWSSKALGSSADYLRATVAARFYVSPFPAVRGLVLTTRLLYSLQSANVPFHAMDTLALTEGDQQGLGGERTLRGYRQDRFLGRAAALVNAEVRWTFVRFPLFGQRFSLQAAPFVDDGRVFDKLALALTQWKPSAGGGLRVGWNQSTIIMFDFAASREDTGFYVDFGMAY